MTVDSPQQRLLTTLFWLFESISVNKSLDHFFSYSPPPAREPVCQKLIQSFTHMGHMYHWASCLQKNNMQAPLTFEFTAEHTLERIHISSMSMCTLFLGQAHCLTWLGVFWVNVHYMRSCCGCKSGQWKPECLYIIHMAVRFPPRETPLYSFFKLNSHQLSANKLFHFGNRVLQHSFHYKSILWGWEIRKGEVSCE